jgi:hypothetical protein
MGRRSRAGGASVKTRRREPAKPKRLSGTAARPRRSSPAGQEPEAARLASELSAMSEILRLISNSPSDQRTVLQSVAEQAAHRPPNDDVQRPRDLTFQSELMSAFGGKADIGRGWGNVRF